MKTKYNIIIEWTIIIILITPLLALIVLKYLLKGIIKIVTAMQTLVAVSIEYIRKVKRELVRELSVKDWLDFGRMLKFVGVCGALSHTPQLSTFQKLSNFHSL